MRSGPVSREVPSDERRRSIATPRHVPKGADRIGADGSTRRCLRFLSVREARRACRFSSPGSGGTERPRMDFLCRGESLARTQFLRELVIDSRSVARDDSDAWQSAQCLQHPCHRPVHPVHSVHNESWFRFIRAADAGFIWARHHSASPRRPLSPGPVQLKASLEDFPRCARPGTGRRFDLDRRESDGTLRPIKSGSVAILIRIERNPSIRNQSIETATESTPPDWPSVTVSTFGALR